MGMRFPVGPMNTEFNPWAHMSPEERLIAERAMLAQAPPEQWNDMGVDPRDPRHPLASDQGNMQQNQYEEMLRDIDTGIQSNVVNPMTEAGYPNLGAGVGAAASAGAAMIPGPEEGIPFVGGLAHGLGMALPPKKIESIMDFMTPEAREAAEQRAKEMRGDLGYEPADPTKVIDPYAKEVDQGNPYAVAGIRAIGQQVLVFYSGNTHVFDAECFILSKNSAS